MINIITTIHRVGDLHIVGQHGCTIIPWSEQIELYHQVFLQLLECDQMMGLDIS